jgi:hypothetical protein
LPPLEIEVGLSPGAVAGDRDISQPQSDDAEKCRPLDIPSRLEPQWWAGGATVFVTVFAQQAILQAVAAWVALATGAEAGLTQSIALAWAGHIAKTRASEQRNRSIKTDRLRNIYRYSTKRRPPRVRSLGGRDVLPTSSQSPREAAAEAAF